VNTVKMFLKRLEELSINFNFKNSAVVAIGNKTAEVCTKNNIPVNIIPKNFSSQGVINEFSSYEVGGKIIFIPRSAIGREELPEGLKSMGAVVKTAPVYNVGIPSNEILQPYIEKLNGSKPELFIFTSPSTFENFLSILNIIDPKKYFEDFNVAAIGPATKEAIEKREVKVDIMPEEYSMDGLEKAIIKFFSV